jgi:molybdopterin converting factor subunit 1
VNHVKVLFFATLRDKAGTKLLELDIEPGATVRQLKDTVVQRIPAIQDVIAHCLAAVNHEYSEDGAEIPTGAEVALFPPVSGG